MHDKSKHDISFAQLVWYSLLVFASYVCSADGAFSWFSYYCLVFSLMQFVRQTSKGLLTYLLFTLIMIVHATHVSPGERSLPGDLQDPAIDSGVRTFQAGLISIHRTS